MVRSLGADDRQAVADQNGRILTCLAQRIPYQSEDVVDWDHVFPSAQARRMWAPGAGRRRHHPDRRLVNTAGNLWALDASTNRALQDKPPKIKFPILLAAAADPDPARPVWPRERWSISDDEVRQFIEVDELLDDDAENVEKAMALFKTLVNGRTARLLDEALDRFPRTRSFAADAEVLPDDPSPTHEFAAALQVARHEVASVAEPAAGVSAELTRWDGRDRCRPSALGSQIDEARPSRGQSSSFLLSRLIRTVPRCSAGKPIRDVMLATSSRTYGCKVNRPVV